MATPLSRGMLTLVTVAAGLLILGSASCGLAFASAAEGGMIGFGLLGLFVFLAAVPVVLVALAALSTGGMDRARPAAALALGLGAAAEAASLGGTRGGAFSGTVAELVILAAAAVWTIAVARGQATPRVSVGAAKAATVGLVLVAALAILHVAFEVASRAGVADALPAAGLVSTVVGLGRLALLASLFAAAFGDGVGARLAKDVRLLVWSVVLLSASALTAFGYGFFGAFGALVAGAAPLVALGLAAWGLIERGRRDPA